MNKYIVSKSITIYRYAEVEAETEDEAVELAQEIDDDSKWKENPNDEYFNDWIYNAELDEEDV